MDYQTYPTCADATKALGALKGWPDATVDHLYLPDDPNANSEGFAQVLQCAPGQYMRTDGFVR